MLPGGLIELDVRTMFVVTIAVTAILGFLLIYAWYQHRKIQALAWWGSAHLLGSAAVWMIGWRGSVPEFWSIELPNALLFVSAGMVWSGARLFDGNKASVIGMFGGAMAWLLAGRVGGFMATAEGPVVFSSMIIALYTFGAAFEFWRGRRENLLSRLPLIVMLAIHGVLYLLRIPLALMFPAGNELFFSAAWFGVIGLESLLYMIATSFIFLAMAKERTELEHKTAALIDPLTGVANRRSFLDSAARQLKQRSREPVPVTALLFDLDRFKSINDQYGHGVGDRVLRRFADLASAELRSTDLFGRLGGEEFGALLFGVSPAAAAATAERIRASLASEDGGDRHSPVTTVSVGVASVRAAQPVDIETLLTRADEALYVAKARGRNRVEIAGAYADGGRLAARAEAETAPSEQTRAEPRSAALSMRLLPSPALAPAMESSPGGSLLRKAVIQSTR